MAAHFDNLDDVNGKFANTIVYYEKKPVYCKNGGFMDDGGELALAVCPLNGKYKYVSLLDPLLNYKDYNIGYANCGTHAAWWFRKPARQYRQGLKKDQMYWRASNAHVAPPENFNFSKPYVAMLANDYPDIEACKQALREYLATTIAFHKDFAIAWDELHEDYLLEYRGKRIGVSLGDGNKFRLIPEAKHLQEALQEALP